MRKLLLNCRFALGDVVMLTAAVRDLHQCYPGEFLTDVRSFSAEVWRHNPYLVPLDPADPEVEVIDCHYPLIHQSNRLPYHCLHGFIEFLNATLGLEIKPTRFHGDIHLSRQEKGWFSQVREWTGEDTPFWIIAAGGKYDISIKWWSTERFQAVVDHFRGRIQFVQIGARGHWHPKLKGVVDLRGRTDVRQLIRLVYHAQGVLCPITGVMHLAAAVETKPGRPPLRPCVVVAGGREPVHWAGYPHHQFVHTVGALRCCAGGGCWRSRTLPLGHDEVRDRPERLCVDVVGDLPRCMHMITAREVIDRIETYFQTSPHAYLTQEQARAALVAVRRTESNAFDDSPLHDGSARQATRHFLRSMPAYSRRFRGRGIVICAGSERYLLNAWVCIHMLRHVGCELPIDLWTSAGIEPKGEILRRLKALGVRPVSVPIPRDRGAAWPRRPVEWEMKPHALLHGRFRKVLLLDADNVPVIDPAFLFEEEHFRESGAVFWSDGAPFELSERACKLLGVAEGRERGFEAGQILLDMKHAWPALQLARWYSRHADYFCRHFPGDTAFQVAFRKLGLAYAMPSRDGQILDGAVCHHDFEGRRLFQHRRERKWDGARPNHAVAGFALETECLAFVEDYRTALRDAVGVRPDFVSARVDEGPSDEARIWHVFGRSDPRVSPFDKREPLARETWARQYVQANWRPFPVWHDAVPRLFRERGRRLFFLKDVMEEAMTQAGREDWIVLTDTDACAAPSLTRRLLPILQRVGACYAYRREFRGEARFLNDDQIGRLERQASCGLVAFSVSFWKHCVSRLPDVVLGEPQWDSALRRLIKQTFGIADACFDDLIYERVEAAESVPAPVNGCFRNASAHNRKQLGAMDARDRHRDAPFDWIPVKVKSALPPVTICVLTYGDYPKLAMQCLESIRRFCPRSRYRLALGANAVCVQTRRYVEALHARGEIDHLVISETNLNKCPLMRHLFDVVETEYIWWFDDDSYLTREGVLECFHRTARESTKDTVMWGRHAYAVLPPSGGRGWGPPHEFVRRASWYGGLPMPGEPIRGKNGNGAGAGETRDPRWFFVTGGSWWIRRSAVRELDWPDARLVKELDDVYLGEAIRQRGWRCGHYVPPGLVINSATRRGEIGLMRPEGMEV